ncbi:hypothetical protein NSK_006404 [Nannochloropsis salina CCMP1776]|uniref:DUF1214 domain-containing protein n=1 Tax=Nannochloropsis salina CCMP1776 TaxID=1027361 RepID=A0A4D9CUL8_9STRA|nr:hypothetical protein NSK_006404 [Nannochloropsis salina CCMP1776]|eukprot:TFJ82284.1 hypothetical protein NSK_006404 [Nannochloropsis salina CCMP1776]
MTMTPLRLFPLKEEIAFMGVITGVGATIIFFPLLLRFPPILRKIRTLHTTPLSDVPGCPEHYDEAFTSALFTLPDPNNYLSVYSYIPLDEGVRFRHPRMPVCRYFSLSLYAGLFDPVQDQVPPSLCDMDLVYNLDESFDVAICDEEERPADISPANWLPRHGVRDGLLVVRRYGTLPGQRLDMPSFHSMGPSTPKELKPAHHSFSGPHYAEKAPSHRFQRLLRVLAYLGSVACALLLAGRWSAAEITAVLLVAGAMPAILLHLLYARGRRKAKRVLSDRAYKVNEFTDPPEARVYDADSPKAHPNHKYFSCPFDARKGDLLITGRIFPGKQRMWTFVVYDECGLPQYQHFTDETLRTSPGAKPHLPGAGRGRKGTEEPRALDGGKELAGLAYRLVLTTDMRRHSGREENVVDVSRIPQGLVLLRLIYPETREVFERSKPSVTVLCTEDARGHRKQA